MAGDRAPIDFGRLADALLDRVESLLPQWLPHGVERNGRWYVGDFDGGSGESANVNMRTGQWIDNAAPDSEKGGDLISLYARVRGLSNGEAARELMRDMGWERVQAPVQMAQPVVAGGERVAGFPPEPPADDGGAPAARREKRESKWQAVVPVPRHAPTPEFRFGFKNKKTGEWLQLDAVRTWAYEFEGELYGHVARFERVASDGEVVKDTLPLTWCTNLTDGRGSQRWHWKMWDAPRPLYVPATVLSGDPTNVPVVIVEGEKCAEAAFRLLGHEFDFVSWPGGCKTWHLASWQWLMGRTVYLWPDCDAKRTPQTAAERQAGDDPALKPLLPEWKQPGMRAMVGIGSLLMANHGCTVHMCSIPAPLTVDDGWDVADAIEEGWGVERVRAFIRAAHPFEAPDDAARAKARAGKSTPSRAGAGPGGDADGDDAPDLRWRTRLLTTQKGATLAVRDNLVLALDGVPVDGVPGIDAARGVIAFNEFTNDVIKLKPPPWGGRAGVWEEEDELEMGNWLTREHWLPSMPRGTLEEAVLMVSKRHRFHPVRERLERLRGTWDGEKRLATWLRRACMAEGDVVDAPTQQYLARVGTWLLMAMCARVLPERKDGSRVVCGPGTKFDYMVIFEGAQGARKSTLASVLGWEYAADTGLVLGEKDSYQNLQGVWMYEWGELDSLSKSEVTRVKQFVSSQKDRFRASFDRRPKDYPRQVVFIGTTNEDHYLTDTTGNRRFWPVSVTREIDIAWVLENLEQMFAEAVSYVDAGERFHPTTQEQRQLFDPQQQQRTVENAIESEILRYLYDEDQSIGHSGVNGAFLNEISMTDLLKRIGYTTDKQTSVVMRQAGSAMRRLGWPIARSSKPGRPRVYCRPKETPMQLRPEAGASNSFNRPTQGDKPAGAEDDCPF